jgi:hypothetical protein
MSNLGLVITLLIGAALGILGQDVFLASAELPAPLPLPECVSPKSLMADLARRLEIVEASRGLVGP